MGFLFILIIGFLVLPVTGILTLIWIVTRKRIWGLMLLFIWAFIVGLVWLAAAIHPFITKKVLERDDIYGAYVIDRSKCPGKQADWQYDHYRFEITPQNKFYFHVTDKERVVKTYTGTVSFLEAYKCRLVLHVDSPAHHIMEEKPTLYREVWSFYYVFNSPKYGNVFFRKGKWRPIKE